jgi:flavin reductase (DIM6/NTAB) family NADH-FMN oxidoreductase RutF
MINDAQAVQDQFDHVDLSALNRAQRYKLLTGAVIPRPIAFVTTLGPDGIVNAAPFSQFVILAVDPGLLGVSVGPRDGGRKDTLVNIEASREFVINMVPEGWEQAVQRASMDHPPEISEVKLLGLETMPSLQVKPPRLAGSKIQFECRLEQILLFGDAPNSLVVGKVVAMHIRFGLATDCKIDPKAYSPVARIGGRNYVRFGDILEV